MELNALAIAAARGCCSVDAGSYGAALLKDLAPIYDNDAWLSSLNGYVGMSRHGDRVRARASNPGSEFARYYHLHAYIDFHIDDRKIGKARLKLRREPQVGLVVMVEWIGMHPVARGLGIGSAVVVFWTEALRALGVTAMYFDAVRSTHGAHSGRTFWAREGVLFRDPGTPARLFENYVALLDRHAAGETNDPEGVRLSWWQRFLDRGATPQLAMPKGKQRALERLKRRIHAGELPTPADLYADPLGRDVLAAGDWRGWWPIDDDGSWPCGRE
jgi:GNAT superfamily N-acetyltransferase